MIGLLLVSAGCSAARSSYVDVSQVVTYRLTHRTRIEFTSPVEVLRVYHARPIQPTWMSSNTLWISEPTLMPPDAVVEKVGPHVIHARRERKEEAAKGTNVATSALQRAQQ